MARLLSDLTTMRVGGPAREIVAPVTEAELITTALDIWAGGDDWLALGGGSNLVIGDDGFDGTVIHLVTRGIDRVSPTRLRVQAGEPWDGLVQYTVDAGLSGIEALSGIPGSSGAAPIQNIGAYGQELADTLVSVDFLDYITGDRTRIAAADLALGYRTSVLKTGGRPGIVLAIELELAETPHSVIRYPQLASALSVEVGATVPLALVRTSVLALRAAKGMVLDAADPDSVSCGSFFTNPIVGENFARSLPASAPRWPVSPPVPDVAVPVGSALPVVTATEDDVKLSAAWLIEAAGIPKGFALPGSRAAISSKHTLAITNRGGATAAEVGELARFVQAMVLSRFGVHLQAEPVAVGVQL